MVRARTAGSGARPRWRPTSPARSLAPGQGRRSVQCAAVVGCAPSDALRDASVLSFASRTGLGKRGQNLPRPAPHGRSVPEPAIRAAKRGEVAADAPSGYARLSGDSRGCSRCQAGGGCRRHPRTWTLPTSRTAALPPARKAGRNVAVPETDKPRRGKGRPLAPVSFARADCARREAREPPRRPARRDLVSATGNMNWEYAGLCRSGHFLRFYRSTPAILCRALGVSSPASQVRPTRRG